MRVNERTGGRSKWGKKNVALHSQELAYTNYNYFECARTTMCVVRLWSRRRSNQIQNYYYIMAMHSGPHVIRKMVWNGIPSSRQSLLKTHDLIGRSLTNRSLFETSVWKTEHGNSTSQQFRLWRTDEYSWCVRGLKCLFWYTHFSCFIERTIFFFFSLQSFLFAH